MLPCVYNTNFIEKKKKKKDGTIGAQECPALRRCRFYVASVVTAAYGAQPLVNSVEFVCLFP